MKHRLLTVPRRRAWWSMGVRAARRPVVAWGFRATAVLGVVSTATGCALESDVSQPPVSSVTVTVTPPNAALQAGDTLQLSAVAKTADGSVVPSAFTWNTSSASVATVSGAGLVTALAPGQATITARAGRSVAGVADIVVRPVLRTLFVSFRGGVTGHPQAGAQLVPEGSRVSYSFRPAPGFANLAVRVDSAVVPSDGSLTVNGDVTLNVTVDTVIVPTQLNAPIIASLRNIIAAPSPYAAFRHLDAQARTMFGVLGGAEARRQLDVARVLAYDPTQDGAAVWRAAVEIGDSLRADDLAVVPTQVQARHAATESPTTFVYINGIDTDPLAANTTINNYLGPVLSAAGYSDRRRYPLRRSYNNSAKNISDGAVYACLQQRSLAVVTGYWSAAKNIGQCLGRAADLAEAARQVISGSLLTLPPTDDVNHLVQIVRGILGNGSRVVLVGHSQGNLVASDALKLMSRTTPRDRVECVGMVSVAPPVLVQQVSGGNSIGSVIVRGKASRDILQVFGLARGVPSVTSLLSDAWDTYFFLPLDLWNQIAAGMQLHEVNSSYLTMIGAPGVVGPRDRIIELLKEQTRTVEQNCPSPSGPVPAAGQMDVRVLGLPSGVAANVQLTGPNGYGYQLTGSQVVSDLEPGTYRLTAARITAQGTELSPSPVSQQVVVSSGTTVRATVQYTPLHSLNLSGSGSGSGGVVSSPSGLTCALVSGVVSGSCVASFSSGTVVTLTAVPGQGNSFAGWSGACVGNVPTCVVTMTQSRSVTAAFVPALPSSFALTVGGAGSGSGMVSSSPSGLTCTITGGIATGACSTPFASGTVVTLTAVATQGHSFAGWSGACTGNTCQVTMSQARTVTATFIPAPPSSFALTISGAGSGNGTVSSSPSGLTCAITGGVATGACGAPFASGTAVTLTAVPGQGHSFTGWSGACTGNNATCQVTMTQAQVVIASFGLSGARGSLQLVINGVPSGAQGDVTVTGPSSFAGRAVSSTVFPSVATGTYTVTGQDIVHTGLTYTASPQTQQVVVNANTTSTATVTYAYQPTPTALASSLQNPHNIAVDGGVVYWVENNSTTGRIRSVSVHGGSITTFASGLVQPSAIGVDQTHVYWIERGGSTSSSSLKRMPKGGGSIQVLASNLRNSQNRLALDGNAVYFGESVQGGGATMVRVPKAGGAKTVIATGILNLETAVATDGTSVYFSDGRNSVMKVPVSGGSPTVIASGEPKALVLRGSTLYWVEYSGAFVRSVGITGGAVTTLAAAPGSGEGVATDGTWVFWITTQGVFKVSANGGAVTQISNKGNSIGVALDGSNVYWATDPVSGGSGQILKFPK